MFRLRIRKWFFPYLEYIMAILVTLGLYLVKDFIEPLLPSWLLVLPLVIALVVRSVRDMVKGRREQMTKLANYIDSLSTEFVKFTKESCGYSIRSIAKDLISKYSTTSEKIKGWAAYFDENWGMPAQLFKNYDYFEKNWRKYIENPKGKEELSGLVIEFLNLVGLHYKMHENFGKMVRDVGDREFEQRYNDFKKEYDEFYRGLRGIAPELKKALGVELEGKFYYAFAKDFPESAGSQLA